MDIIVLGSMEENNKMHIVMYPWLAMGHLITHLNISNKLAKKGHRISFLLPPNALSKLEALNLHPLLISFIPVPVPDVPGLPPASQTTHDVPFHLQHLLMSAFDLTRPQVHSHLLRLRPDVVVFDFAHWMPDLARPLGIKSIHYCTISSATIGYLLSPSRGPSYTESDLLEPPPGFPPSKIKLKPHEARALFSVHDKTATHGDGSVSFQQRIITSFTNCDAIAFKTTKEVEGPYCDYLEKQFKKPVLLAGPVLPEELPAVLDEKWQIWLDAFPPYSVIYCAFGSECIMGKSQFQEVLLGLELTGMPFLAALKPPAGAESVEDALPEGFEERVVKTGRGAVWGGWVQQQHILRHPAVGCFVTHCGSGSLAEAMVAECQLVLLPDKGDQIINARMMGGDLWVGVEVDILDGRDGVCVAIRSVVDEEGEIAKEVRRNHEKQRQLLLTDGFEDSYFDAFVHKLLHL